MLKKSIIISIVVSIIALSAILQTTTPTTIGPLGILVVFILIYITALGVLTFLLKGGNYAAIKIGKLLSLRRPVQRMTLGRAYYFSSVIALAPVMLVGVQSVTDIGIYDITLVALFTVIACVYVGKRI